MLSSHTQAARRRGGCGILKTNPGQRSPRKSLFLLQDSLFPACMEPNLFEGEQTPGAELPFCLASKKSPSPFSQSCLGTCRGHLDPFSSCFTPQACTPCFSCLPQPDFTAQGRGREGCSRRPGLFQEDKKGGSQVRGHQAADTVRMADREGGRCRAV